MRMWRGREPEQNHAVTDITIRKRGRNLSPAKSPVYPSTPGTLPHKLDDANDEKKDMFRHVVVERHMRQSAVALLKNQRHGGKVQ